MASAPSQTAGQKRKVPSSQPSSSSVRKRQKVQIARAIPIQSTDVALSATGELNVASFIKAREFEINALDRSMLKAKKGLSARAFQQVPRNMRRRTASHNVKKVPRRLRSRAGREMKEDNTPTVTARRRTPSRRLRLRLETAKLIQMWNMKAKNRRHQKKESKQAREAKEARLNAKESDPEHHISISRLPRLRKNKLADPPKATSKFKRRQIQKSWLPTHLWHTKRAHMTKPTEPLWRMAIPLSPTEKSYRPTHRASGTRGCMAWDMSYMATIGCQGLPASLENMLRAIGFHGEGWAGAKYKKWRAGTRSASGWVHYRDGDGSTIGPITVIWQVERRQSQDEGKELHKATNRGSLEDMEIEVSSTAPQRKPKLADNRLLLRVHPSAFHILWLEAIKVAKMQRPQVLLEDLRFEIGTIEVTGPGSTEALLGVLKPVFPPESSSNAVNQVWTSLAGLENPASLPLNCLLGFNVIDPRLNHPPKQIPLPKTDAELSVLTELMLSWPPDKTQGVPDIFSHKARLVATKLLLSQKAINRRKTLAVTEGSASIATTDPKIPALLLATRSSGSARGNQGSWTLLLPWMCVEAVWRSLVYYPLSSGGVPRFGGLDEVRQVCFERGLPWYPGDAPGTAAGKAWELSESEKRFDAWIRNPPSRRTAWESLDLRNGKKGEVGRGWACDWEFLLAGDGCRIEPVPARDVDVDRMESTQQDELSASTEKLLTQRQRKAAKAKSQAESDKTNVENDRRRNTSSPESDRSDDPPVDSDLRPSPQFTQLPPLQATAFVRSPLTAALASTASLMAIRITYLTRGTPSPCARIYRLPSSTKPGDIELRKEWLALDRLSSAISSSSPMEALSTTSKPAARAPRLNRHGQPTAPRSYPLEPLEHITYLPKDAVPEVVATFGPDATSNPLLQKLPTAAEHAALLQTLMKPDTEAEARNAHPACPGAADLIGFVTSGAFNLAEGRGAAIGSLWCQRLRDGWRSAAEEEEKRRREEGVEGQQSRNDNKIKKASERRRRLCVVRNAGEEVGRLALWELCE